MLWKRGLAKPRMSGGTKAERRLREELTQGMVGPSRLPGAVLCVQSLGMKTITKSFLTIQLPLLFPYPEGFFFFFRLECMRSTGHWV